MNPRILAVTFTALMLVSTWPVGQATHVDPMVPDVPVLPRVHPTQNCIPVGLDAEILRRANQAIAGDPAFYQDDVGIPSLCLNGPVSDYQRLVNDANGILEHVRNVSREIQRQVNWRLEATLPDSEYPDDLIEPRTVLLNDTFDGHRVGGFGDWTVVTQKGEDPLWRVERLDEVNGTRHAYRFGGAEGYEQGVHQFLVSPELDLTALKGNATAVRDLALLRETARDALRTACNRGFVQGSFSLSAICGENVNDPTLAQLQAVIDAYEMAFDDVIYEQPVMQHGAFLELTYKLNMAPGEDGVRMWVYAGERAPDRRALFNETLGTDDTYRDCVYDENVPTTGNSLDEFAGPGWESVNASLRAQVSYELTCPPRHEGGHVVQREQLVPLDDGQDNRLSPTATFSDAPGGRNPANRVAFTGDQEQWLTARLNLSDWLEERIWIVFEVKTKRDDRGEDIFNDPSRFPRKQDFGFQLDRLRAEGAGYHRNFRMKDVAATYTYQIPGNAFDDPITTRTTTPPGDQPVVAWVHNAGDYIENGTVTFTARARSNGTSASFAPLGTYSVNVSLRPDEVRTLSVPWGRLLTPTHETLRENWLYEVSATLSEQVNQTNLPDQLQNVGNQTPPILDPNVTRVRPPNAASVTGLDAGSISATALVRAATIRDVTLLRADRLSGNPVQLCRSVDGVRCDEHYAGPKGEPRVILVGVRNDGNTPQNITLDLTATLDGVGKPDIVTDGVRQVARDVLPGEVRAVTWTVIATQPGAYDLTVTPMPDVPPGVAPPKVENGHRKLFVQRSTGLICLDTLSERECGPSFNGDLVPLLRNENITASAYGADGTLYVATEIREPQGSLHSGQLAARDASGVWRIVANLSAKVLNETLLKPPHEDHAYGSIRAIVPAPGGAIYLVGDNHTALRVLPATTGAATIEHVPLAKNLTTHLRAAIWYKDTLLTAGANGVVARLLANGTLEPFAVTNTSYEPNANNVTIAVARAAWGNFTQLVVAPNGQALLGGENGTLLRHDGGSSLTTGWTEARVLVGSTSRIFADVIGNSTAKRDANITALGVHEGRVLVGGMESLFASAVNSTAGWQRMLLPPPVPEHAPRRVLSVGAAPDGRLYVLQGASLATCDDCYAERTDAARKGLPTWEFVLPVRPVVEGKGVLRQAVPSRLVAGAAGTTLVGEAGMVLDLADEGEYDNMLDWSVIPKLAPRDGGVIQTRRGSGDSNIYQHAGLTIYNQSIFLLPDAEGRGVAQKASKFRLFLNHSLNWTHDDPNAPEARGIRVNLVYRPYPSVGREAAGAGAHTCAPVAAVGLNTVCNLSLLRHHVAFFGQETKTDGWEFLAYPDLPVAGPVAHPAPASDPVGSWFWAIEVGTTNAVRWALDDIRLQGLDGQTWKDVVTWYGPQIKKGDWYVQDPYNFAFSLLPEPDPIPLPDETCVKVTSEQCPLKNQNADDSRQLLVTRLGTEGPLYAWEVSTSTTFDHPVVTPWHLSTDYADRPVFAANNEFFKQNWSDPTGPRLLSNWDARLVSPVIDLTHAYDPVVAWRHLYSFRTQVSRSDTAGTVVQPSDGGFVEVQYTLKGEECGSTDPEFVCWSRFYPVRVDGGYPHRADVGFADVEAANYREYNGITPSTGSPQSLLQWTALPPVKAQIGQGVSYWGGIASPDSTGRITDTRLTEKYVPASITLDDARCKDTEMEAMRNDPNQRINCIPHNVTGRQIRVAFHLMTAGYWQRNATTGGYEPERTFNESHPTPPSEQRSFPGEGWYITDFRVLGAKELGIDLRVADLSFRVGYDVDTIGVGPSTRVPVNVTVENRGVFDALGYTGTLEVHRVLDRATQRTELVDVITLSQQPVLEPMRNFPDGKGGWRNHTLFWNVPATENAEYALSFKLDPIGIDRDEDHLDNAKRLGTSATPILAKTVRQFKVEFLVSPENATSDITRYIPMFVNNTGNVPLDGFTIERRITAIGRSVLGDASTCEEWQSRVVGGAQTAIVDCRVWTTQRPAPAGTLTPLTILSDEVNPTTDLFWKAPERATFLVSLTGETLSGGAPIVASAEKRIAAFATYLFDDVEGGLRGEAARGEWVYGPGWNVSQPGFRSTDAYGFGDAATGRYPADADGQLVAPVIDLGSARTAQLAFYTSFAFEPGFDGGIVEASDDGGKTWTPLVPIDDPLVSASYNKTESHRIQASSVLHPDGDPDRVATAFTGDSALLPSNVDGWVLSQIDLTDYANVTEEDVEYEAYHASEMSRYSRPPNAAPAVAPNVYRAADWCPGSPSDHRCWSAENLTQATVTAPTAKAGEAENTFWWSGSASRYDDHLRPIQNHLLEFEVDLSGVQSGQQVVAEWWEYGSRVATKSVYLDTASANVRRTLTAPDILTVHTFHPSGAPADNYRFNLGEPKIVETKGKWYRMQSDLTDLIPRLDAMGTRTLTVGFAYTPVVRYSSNFTCTADACTATSLDIGYTSNSSASDGTEYAARSVDDRGFAIDGFKVETFRVTRGAPGPRTTLIDEASAWDKIVTQQGGNIWECGIGVYPATNPSAPPEARSKWIDGNSAYVACLERNNATIRRAPFTLEPGRNWGLATELPGINATWRIVPVTDFAGHHGADPLPTGDKPVAWYTGDLGCRGENGQAVNESYCPRPGSEARLVTPAFDLGRIAGDNAQLSFWHRYAFYQRNLSATPLASGGVVEISVLDAQTGTWSPWEQLYASEDFSVGTSLTPVRDGSRGGYSGFTANFSPTTEGPRRFDPPFHNVIPTDLDRPVQFLFTGVSKSIEEQPGARVDGLVDGWLREEFDVSEFIGRKVRFGFHYAFGDHTVSAQQSRELTDPDQAGQGGRTGWWISDVAVVGDVLVGKPVQLRFRAGTDGNVHDGRFLVDDIGVFGARYRNNVGIFVDGSDDRFGAYPNTTTTIPVTIRNLGDTVRRDLALEVRLSAPGVALKVSGLGPGGNATLEDGAYLLTGYTLGPGQSAVANVTIETPTEFGAATGATIILQLREANPQSQTRPFGPIPDNEVQGLLEREVAFRLQRDGEFERLASGIRQVTPALGEPVEFVLTGRNPGHGPVTLEAECTARTTIEHVDTDHRTTSVDTPVVTAVYPCDIDGKLTLASKEWTNLTFRATPTHKGFLSFAVKLSIVGGGNQTIPPAGVPVGVPLVTYRETFDAVESLLNFTGSDGGLGWSQTRGHKAPGSLVLGIDESLAVEGLRYDACGANVPCLARTPPIDLHNYSGTTPAYLSFYHLDRMARHDGAQVRAQVLRNERNPNADQSWSAECILRPIHDYEGVVRQRPPPQNAGNPDPTAPPQASDPNPAFSMPGYDAQAETSPPDFFVTPGGVWEEAWSLAVFRLPESCESEEDDTAVPLLGRTVRFTFYLFPGAPNEMLRRGNGHGFLVDEISVGPLALDVRPALPQRAHLLDNTTKAFNVLLENLGKMPDVVRLEFDALNSSAPAGSVRVPDEHYTLMPGERRIVSVWVTLPRDPSLLPTEFAARILARSVLDPNAAGATVLSLQFGPRQWAELAVSVQPPKGIVQEATETFIPVTVENTGLVDSVASRLRIVDEWEGGRIEHTLELPSMPSAAQSLEEALRVLEFRWRPERGSVGDHTLTFEVDPDVLGEEYTRTNNLVQIVVPVSDLLIPDLHVGNFSALRLRNAVGGTVTPGFDADVARYEVTAGEVVSFELKVANKGRAGATNVDVRAFIGALSLPPKTIPYIAPDTEAVVTFNWLAQKGEHEIEFIVRSEQVELTATNNRYPGTGVTILTVKGYEVAVEIPPIDGLLEPASEILVPFRITNNGNAGEDLELRATTPSGMRLMLPREGFFLRAGESYEDNARLILAAEAVAGQQFISIDAVARENPMKVASGRAALGVLASYGGSVAGGYAVGAPPELTVPIELVNEGNSLEPWTLVLSLPPGWSAKETMPARVVVPAHDRATFQFHLTVPAGTAPGDRVLAVSAEMPNGEKREGVARVAVLPLRAASVNVQEGAPVPDKGSLSVPIRVQNTGNVREPFSLLLVDPPAGVEMRVEPAEFLLPPGGEAVATLIVKPNATIDVGTYAVVGYTRFEGVIPQTSEGLANVQSLRVPIVRQDLRVTSLEFSPRAELDVGDRVTVRVVVQNFGQFEVANVPVHLFVDDLFQGEVLVPAIAAGARADVTFNWTATSGVHTLTAVADPYEDTVDAGREDNAMSVLATVGVDAANGAVAAGRADAPFGGAWLVVAAVALGMLVARRSGSWRRERR